MEEAELERSEEFVQSEAAAEEARPKQTKKISELLTNFGGFSAIRGFLPDADNLNPDKKAARAVFLSDKRFAGKRQTLINDMKAWIEALSKGASSPTELVEACKQNEAKYQKILAQGITDALVATANLERSYRSLDFFFKNANTDKVKNLRIINVFKDDIADGDSGFDKQIDELLKGGFDRLSLKDSYSLMAIPGYVFRDKPTLLKWAKIAFKYKVMLITDHDNEFSFDDLQENTSNYKDSDMALMNVIMTANWLVGRESEKLSEDEKEFAAFYVPPTGALVGKLYDDSASMAQGAGGKKYGTLTDVKGVKIDLLKSQIASLMDNQVIPMVYSEGRVMAFNNSTLYNGDNTAMKEYPIVRVFDWVKKVLMNFVHEVALENWDPYNSPKQLKASIQAFLNEYKGYGNLFQNYDIKEPVQDPVTKRITCDVSLTPFYAAKNFVIKVAADKNSKSVEG